MAPLEQVTVDTGGSVRHGPLHRNESLALDVPAPLSRRKKPRKLAGVVVSLLFAVTDPTRANMASPMRARGEMEGITAVRSSSCGASSDAAFPRGCWTVEVGVWSLVDHGTTPSFGANGKTGRKEGGRPRAGAAVGIILLMGDMTLAWRPGQPDACSSVFPSHHHQALGLHFRTLFGFRRQSHKHADRDVARGDQRGSFSSRLLGWVAPPPGSGGAVDGSSALQAKTMTACRRMRTARNEASLGAVKLSLAARSRQRCAIREQPTHTS